MSSFGDRFEQAFKSEMLRVLGDSAAYTTVAGVTSTVVVVFNEFVGAIDNKQRAIFTVSSEAVAAPQRGDSFVLDGETQRWDVVDVRASRAGEFELRCDATLEES